SKPISFALALYSLILRLLPMPMSLLKCIVLWMLLCCTAGKISAQQSNQILGLARQFVATGAYEKAAPLLKQLYDEAPFDKNRYDEYLDALLLAQQFETAHELVQYMAKIRRTDPVMEVDRARVFEQEGKSKEAKEHYKAALSQFPADELVTKRLANAFEQLGQIEFAIEAYEQARQQWQNPYIYATELSLLYAKNGNTEKAMNALLDVAMSQSSALEQVKSSLLTLLGEGGKKTMTLFQKTLQKRLTQVPDNPALNELNSWIYITNGNYEGALKQIIALDKKLEESGQRVLNFGKQAALDEQ